MDTWVQNTTKLYKKTMCAQKSHQDDHNEEIASDSDRRRELVVIT